MTGFSTIISYPVVYAIFILICFETKEYYPDRTFNSNLWKADSNRRYEYTHDLIKRKLLIGKTKPQVLQILGDHGDTSQTELYYYIGYRPEVTGIDPSNIVIEFKSGKADSVIENDH